jgi:MoaA/NifB/PqqE/SkfB family radical SAM enzyme
MRDLFHLLPHAAGISRILQFIRPVIVSRFARARVPLISLAAESLQQGRPWLALKVVRRALEPDAHRSVSHDVLLPILRQMPCPSHWRGFFERAGSPSICDLSRDGAPGELLHYLIEFVRAVKACEAPDSSERLDTIRFFFHRWWRVYRHEDSRIGRFAAYGNSDQSQPIGALRHVIESSAYMQLARDAGEVDENGEVFHRRCCDLALELERHAPDLAVLLLAADHLAALGRLDEARDRGHRAFDLNTRCLLTQHVLDCVERALERRKMKQPIRFSLLEETSRRYAGKFCPVPFDRAFINPDGDTFLCCAAMLPVPIGNVFRDGRWDAIWNSPVAQELRKSILDGSYKYCNKRSCNSLLNNSLMDNAQLLNTAPESFRHERWRDAVANKTVRIDDVLFADLGYDISCNLSCPQCRLGLVVADKPGFAKLDALRNGMIDDLMASLKIVRLSSGGEALFSRHMRKLMGDINPERCPSLSHLELLTNGMLFDRRQWETFKNLHYLRILLAVSVDASSKEVFESVRRNGRWEKMVANLEFASSLRKARKITMFLISYAVQTENFRDMPGIVTMAEKLGVDNLSFFKLENVGTYSEEEFRRRNIVEPSHPRHGELLEVLRNPVFSSPILGAHNLAPLIASIHGPSRRRKPSESDPFWGELYR